MGPRLESTSIRDGGERLEGEICMAAKPGDHLSQVREEEEGEKETHTYYTPLTFKRERRWRRRRRSGSPSRLWTVRACVERGRVCVPSLLFSYARRRRRRRWDFGQNCRRSFVGPFLLPSTAFGAAACLPSSVFSRNGRGRDVISKARERRRERRESPPRPMRSPQQS